MPTPGELSPHSEIKPPQLALELAKQEMQEREKEAFEALLVKRLSAEMLKEIIRAKEDWAKKIAEEGDTEDDLRDPNTLSSYELVYMINKEAFLKGEFPDPEHEEILLSSAERVNAYFDYSPEGNVNEIRFDLVFPEKVSKDEVDYNRNRINEIRNIYGRNLSIARLPKFGEGGLPARNPEFVKAVDFDHEPAVERIRHTQGIDFKKIWDELQTKMPEGASYFLEEIINKEQASLEKLIFYHKQNIKKLERERLRLIAAGEPAGQLLFEVETEKSSLENSENELDGLFAYKKANLKRT